MHTEEDTFNRLRRPSFDEMLKLIVPKCHVGEHVATKGDHLNLLEPNGWNKKDFEKEFYKEENSSIITNAYKNYL